MIAVDTNILVYSHREDSPFFQAAFSRLAELAESGALWAIPWPCLHEFIAIVTHPASMLRRLRSVRRWRKSKPG